MGVGGGRRLVGVRWESDCEVGEDECECEVGEGECECEVGEGMRL